MFRLFKAEMKKVLQSKLFIIAIPVILIANICLLSYIHKGDENTPSISAYGKLSNELKDKSNEEKLKFVEEYYMETQGLMVVEKVKKYHSWNSEQGNYLEENLIQNNYQAYIKYLSMFENGDYLRYTKSLMQECALAKEVYEEFNQVASYDDYLVKVQQNSERLSGVSIFSSKISDGFSSENISKTAEDYKNLNNVNIKYDVSYGVKSSINSITTDCLVFIFLFILGFIMVYDEKEKGLFLLIKSTPNGRLSTVFAKMLAMMCYSFVIVLILYGSNFIFSQINVGLGDLGRNIQSVGEFMKSTLNISIFQFIILFLLMKCLVCFIIGLFVFLVSLLIKKSPVSFFLCSIILFSGFLLYTNIPLNNKITFLKYTNFFGLFNSQDIIGKYLNIDILGKPVSVLTLCLTTMLVYITIFVICSLIAFGKVTKGKSVSVAVNRNNKSKGKRKTKGILFYELYKSLWINKAGVILVAYLYFLIYGAVNQTVYLTGNDMIYKNYMNDLSGPLTTEKEDYIKQEQEKFQDILDEMSQVEIDLQNGKITDIEAVNKRNSLERENFSRTSFEMVLEKYNYILNHDGAYFTYDTGYSALFDTEDTRNTYEMLNIIIVIILCTCFIFPIEHINNANELIRTTPLGRSFTIKRKLLIATGITSVITIAGIASSIFKVIKNYGLSNLTAPANSLEMFSNFPDFFNIITVLILYCLLKLIASFATASAVILISRLVKHNIFSLLLSLLIVLMPVIFMYAGINWAGYLSLSPLFRSGAFIYKQQIIILGIYVIVAVVIILANILFGPHTEKAFHKLRNSFLK